MKAEIQQRLLDLNRKFYATVADDFDATRLNLPMGMVRVLNYVRPLLRNKEYGIRNTESEIAAQPNSALRNPPSALRVLDAGCGNGRFCWALEMLETPVEYVGLDADERLLTLAGEHAAKLNHVKTQFVVEDLAGMSINATYAEKFAIRNSQFTIPHLVTCFAVLHHIPDSALRESIVHRLSSTVAPGGKLILSNWQFMNSPRLVAKQIDWTTIGVDPAEVEPGDALLPWNQGSYAVRYVHQIDEDEMRQLAEGAGLTIEEFFYADGKEGNLNLYVVCKKEEL